ncbi:MAG TPA: tetratricopeptide repeat protein [Pirellulaceae bacterium]|nr:tetratricopeptide repeat protein [Pirellulaceae bacterium]HMO91508.1 tetratricopeptide repeat protein [Pirellulaceae bacterium]HMP70981.1 tetratricopeptide repeat protein [Pirellulaceae bacterium]
MPFHFNILTTFVVLVLVASSSGCGTVRYGMNQQHAATARALNYDGLNAFRKGKLENANRLFAEAARIAPNDARIQENLATCLLEQGEIDEAIKRLQSALETTPDDSRLNLQLGELYLNRGRPDLAENHAKVVIQLNRSSAAAWKLQGQAEAIQGRHEAALRSLLRATSLDSQDQRLQYEVASIFHKLERHSLALATLENLRRTYPLNAEPDEFLSLEGSVLMSLNRPERTISRLARFAQTRNAHPDVLYVLCQAYIATGDHVNAQLTSGLALDKNPHDPRFAALIRTIPSTIVADVADGSAAR